MAISQVEVFLVEVPFAKSFALGSGAVGASGGTGDVIYVKVTTDEGAVGWGEQRALPSWSYETRDTIISVLARNLAPLVLGTSPFAVEAYHQAASQVLSPSVSNGFPFARAALDLALHDAAGQLAGVPISDLLGGAVTDALPLCSAVGVASPQEMATRVLESSAFHAYKLKVGGDPAADAARVLACAEVAGGKPIWLDANQSYRPSDVGGLLRRIGDVPGLACLEQPVPSTNWGAMARLRERLDVPLAIDEGSFTASDLARTITLGAADMVVVKVCKSGGLRQALKTAAVAQAHGVEVLSSGLTDTGIGFVAALHLFSQLDLALPAELNGPELLAELYVEGLQITDGVAQVPTGPGLGVTVDEDRIRGLATEITVVRARA
ncbi:muconate cycloisomerase [Propioniciclava coleopterorum]|uniref:Muconate cycloisomerase n=1 Tax=Propioniciclava coleopterorum TaxID=2714937 RepID=A0A6G7YA79_9ACTN|nr:enolase C-terminal domain-like protein [Propioniciclava coleopterorum]QIK73703.1 muconate cycloisomerase [Propioniciclava coleopterorum]